jgi:signal transduction histidine kinase
MEHIFMLASWLKRLVSPIRENVKLALLTSVLLCLAISFVSFFIFYFSIRTYHMNRHSMESMEAKMQELKQDFQAYVLENGISSIDVEDIMRWTKVKRILVFIGGAMSREDESRMKIDIGPDGFIFSIRATIRYKNGDVQALLSYNPSSAIRFASWTTSLLLAFDVFLLSLFLVLRKKLDYIQRIERGIGILESGRLSHTIPVEGEDELARLAEGLNIMSRGIQARIESEQELLAANRQIIGDLSHDIRTPLSVGMGYLTLLLEKEKLSDQEQMEYLTLALKKAEQIEERTRMLLEFSTLTSEQLPVHKIAIDTRAMANQLKVELGKR